ncbi:MAG TPA: M1 family peptidase, partial [Gemmatimonadales bacterium]|nr:M1 family peptidase [Gemmatimonadales bacterium]
MNLRFIALAALAAACSHLQTTPPTATATATATGRPDRAIQRDIPLTNTIRRAFAAGIRDSSGRPGRNYWQQWMEYTINAKLDLLTSVITGRETIVLHNNSDSTLRSIVLRLDQNIFTPNAERLETISPRMEITKGIELTRLLVNGQAVNLAPPPLRPGV